MTDGIFNVLKPPGMTSHDVVGALRRILQMKKIGHAGTLDPMAAGVLPVFVGHATRFLEYAVEGNKVYRAVITFGVRTDTGDAEGNIVATSPVITLSQEKITHVLGSFIGPSQQIPPMYSAISYNGQKLYKLARKGIEIERQPRDIYIYKLSAVDYNINELIVDVECSKGTFIRTLSEAIATKLGMEGTMSFLLRRQVGDFLLEEAHTLEEIATDYPHYLLPTELAIKNLPVLEVNVLQALRIAQGVATTIAGGLEEGKLYKLLIRGSVVVGVVQAKAGKVCAKKIINIPQKREFDWHEDNN